ncbi:ArsR/SmtB family transcription factor [Noviherbaspirillum galbum]|uniref:Winged helix-turn-helix transcriptional regulator n=1 Tax=Noviherbaspirillum galbum TaxID=2709383 RepID=A0A6B3SVH1_9BURK|nr:winged helix-turn-helix domain-containing protein [Noviherbaspirillum galbum]NEX64747.1 winged helix-turn-helix transcriptional regulator [Noviherbaspirillum galbum]
MRDGPNITNIAALIGDHARAEVLGLLMGGMALTATELADGAGVTRQTISGHLAKLLDAGLLSVVAQGRHRYFRIAGAEVAQLLESLMGVAFGTGAVRVRSSPREPALRKARVCYDHLAGELGVLLYASLARHHAFAVDATGITLTMAGRERIDALGVVLEKSTSTRRPLCRTCLDWSERRDHLAGRLGTALLERFQELGWAHRVPDSRVLAFSIEGETALRNWLGQ